MAEISQYCSRMNWPTKVNNTMSCKQLTIKSYPIFDVHAEDMLLTYMYILSPHICWLTCWPICITPDWLIDWLTPVVLSLTFTLNQMSTMLTSSPSTDRQRYNERRRCSIRVQDSRRAPVDEFDRTRRSPTYRRWNTWSHHLFQKHIEQLSSMIINFTVCLR